MPDPYSLVRPILFALPPEAAHSVTLSMLRVAHRTGLLTAMRKVPIALPVTLMGLTFPNRLGIAAGLDKSATCIDALGALGFGFIEVGTVTPRPQVGNRRPRLFRLTEDCALINRMGFPNDGAVAIRSRLRRRKYAGVCGVNIGKNAERPLSEAASDYVSCLELLYADADYFAVNISSPNTFELRQLQQADRLRQLVDALLEARYRQQRLCERHVPILVKLASDLGSGDLALAARIVKEGGIDGLIASNTTLSRDDVLDSRRTEVGGLSGAPLLDRALSAARCIRAEVGGGYPIIGVGGIDSAGDAQAMRAAGADLLQIYSGLVYRGPALVSEILSLSAASS